MNNFIEFNYVKNGKSYKTTNQEDFYIDFKNLEMLPKLKEVLANYQKINEIAEKLINKKIDQNDKEYLQLKNLYEKVITNISTDKDLKAVAPKYNRLYEHINLGGSILRQWSGFTILTKLPNSLRDRVSCVQTDYDTNTIILWIYKKIKFPFFSFEIPSNAYVLPVVSIGNTTGHYWNTDGNTFPNDAVDGYSSLR
ncbi:hypothetical protein [Chryseobacterium limigenitum]|uniref:Uncharacterized protein n=1 Tax=Chryseobacterium limigenitum TaxID=1612149 RepID=A0A1K2IXD7_9FLAO|nr:hypothetical protein [Chryseobacterium limigenitum]SFZ97084.1 hypothetical protein SAMN05216324_13815 [Chryseobacterium limigenitum]